MIDKANSHAQPMNTDRILLSGKPQLNRKINATLVFGLLQREGPLSRADLAKRTNIRSTSISAIVQQLLEQNLVREIGRGESTGGRHPILLEINPSGLHAAGIEIGEDALNGVVVDLAGQVLSCKTIPLTDTDVENVVQRCNEMVHQLAESSSIPKDQLAGVGVAVPGIISRDEGSVVLSQPLGWRNIGIRERLGTSLQLDVHVLNNAMAGALFEYFGGMGQGARSLLYVLVYLKHLRKQQMTGLGTGIVLDGRAYFGEGHFAGEVLAEIEHPVKTARNKLGEHAPEDIDALTEASLRNPDTYAEVWNVFAKHLAEAVAWGMDFLNPGRVIIGTDVPELGEMVSEQMLEVVRSRSVAGMLTDQALMSEQGGIKLHFAPIRSDTLSRGAIIPRLQELSLTPLLRDSVLS